MSTLAAVPRVNETPHHHDAAAAAAAVKEVDHEHRVELEELKRRRVHFYAAGRVLLSMLFIVSAIAKWAHFGATVTAMQASGLASPGMLLPLAIALELVGGAMLLIGLKTRATAWTLIAYVSLLTALLHYDLSSELNRAQALCNVAFVGALLMLAGHGAGSMSMDKWLAHRTARKMLAKG